MGYSIWNQLLASFPDTEIECTQKFKQWIYNELNKACYI